MSPDEIQRIVEALGNITTVLRDADPADKALIYRELGLTPTYGRQPARYPLRRPQVDHVLIVSEGRHEPMPHRR